MNKIERLIQELCPNGVEWKEVGDVTQIKKGKQLNKSLLTDDGTYPAYNGGQFESGRTDRYNVDENTTIISQGGASAGFVNFITTKFWANAHCYFLLPDKKIINNKYLYHFIKMKQNNLMESQYGSGIPALKVDSISKIKIPIPPLEIQEEIVKILDKFTDYVTELTTELTLRQKQYNYYRDKLLSLEEDKNYQLVQLGTICEIGDGLHGTPKYNDFGDYYFINGNNILNGNIVIKESTKKVSIQDNLKLLKNLDESILISINGTIGNVAYYSGEKVVLGKSVAYLKVKSDNIDLSYLYYYLQTSFSKNYFEANLTGSTIKNLGLKALRGMNIILPSLDRQKKLVSILLKFNQISNDISTGLPKEIELRQKQYEYYRDKLLSFD